MWMGIVAVAAVVCLGVIAVLLLVSPEELGSVRLNERDHDKTVHLHRGQQVVVTLHQEAGHGPWTHPASADPTVLQPAADNRIPGRRIARSVFRAARSGQTQVTAEAASQCEPPPCSQPPVAFAVTLIVDG